MIIKNLQSFYEEIKPNKRLLSVDYGAKKIGFAISDHSLHLAMPLKMIHESVLSKQIECIVGLVKEYDVGGLVFGLPINMDGSVGEQALRVQSFAEKIVQKTDVPIFLQDERLTSKAADNLLKAAGYNRKKRNSVDDLASASLILETTLDARHRL